jgi:hypothetical protein
MLTVATTLRLQYRNVLAYLETACRAVGGVITIPSLVP